MRDRDGMALLAIGGLDFRAEIAGQCRNNRCSQTAIGPGPNIERLADAIVRHGQLPVIVVDHIADGNLCVLAAVGKCVFERIDDKLGHNQAKADRLR